MKFNSILFAVFVLLGGCGNAENKPDGFPIQHQKKTQWSPLSSGQNCRTEMELLIYQILINPTADGQKGLLGNGQVEILAEFTDGTVKRLQQWRPNGIPRWDIGYAQGKNWIERCSD